MRFASMVTAIDLHACGEPGRVITGGVLDVPGTTMFEKMQYFERHHDDVRVRLLREPRGYPALCCNVILPPIDPAAAAGFVIMEQTEYPPMSGTNTMCVATALLETGMIPMQEPVTDFLLEAPAGLIGIRAECRDGKVTSITFRNVPAFAALLDAQEVPHLGTVLVDVAWGGMFYMIADAKQFGLRLTPDEGRDLTRISEMVKAATREQFPVVHPDNPAITGPTIAQLSGKRPSVQVLEVPVDGHFVDEGLGVNQVACVGSPRWKRDSELDRDLAVPVVGAPLEEADVRDRSRVLLVGERQGRSLWQVAERGKDFSDHDQRRRTGFDGDRELHPVVFLGCGHAKIRYVRFPEVGALPVRQVRRGCPREYLCVSIEEHAARGKTVTSWTWLGRIRIGAAGSDGNDGAGGKRELTAKVCGKSDHGMLRHGSTRGVKGG